MAETKTKPTDVNVDDYIAAIENEVRRKDCQALAKLITKATKLKPKMWGPSIVGYGSYHYKYDSGHEGDSCVAGFASRKPDITVYLATDFPGMSELLAKLGKHKHTKACLYIRKLADIDLKVLEQLIVGSVAEIRSKYGS
jgi:hypothetical protein